MAKFRNRFDLNGTHCDVTIYPKSGPAPGAEIVFGLPDGRVTFPVENTDRLPFFAVTTFIQNGITNLQVGKAILSGNPVPVANS